MKRYPSINAGDAKSEISIFNAGYNMAIDDKAKRMRECYCNVVGILTFSELNEQDKKNIIKELEKCYEEIISESVDFTCE